MTEPKEGSGAVELDRRVDEALAALERELPGRIERVMATAEALVVVVDVVDERVEALVEEASEVTPFVAIESRSARQLERLTGGSPLGDARVVRSQTDPPDDWVDRRLDAADVLIESGMHRDAVRLAAEAIRSALAESAGLESPTGALNDLVVWLHTEVAPQLDLAVDTALATRLFGIASSACELPGHLATELLADARRLRADIIDRTNERR